MRYFTAILCSMFLTQLFAQTSPPLQLLIEGNERYINDLPLRADHSSDRRDSLIEGQNPFAVIVGCSDSRVSPEIIFDQGLGNLFTVRIGGNVIGPIELATIDYGARHLGASLILVLGHESCGAVSAVMSGQTTDIEEIAALIKPAIKGSKTLENAIKANVRWNVANLKKVPLLKQLILEKKIDCVGAYYHLSSGKVEILK